MEITRGKCFDFHAALTTCNVAVTVFVVPKLQASKHQVHTTVAAVHVEMVIQAMSVDEEKEGLRVE